MKANEYRVLTLAVEEGVRGGLYKAAKNGMSNEPDEEIFAIVEQYVLNSILEWFDLDWKANHEIEG